MKGMSDMMMVERESQGVNYAWAERTAGIDLRSLGISKKKFSLSSAPGNSTEAFMKPWEYMEILGPRKLRLKKTQKT